MRKVTGKKIVTLVVMFLLLEALVVAVNTRRNFDRITDPGTSPTTDAPTTAPTTSEPIASTTVVPTSAAAVTSLPAPRDVTIDLTATLPRLEPHQIASFPIVAPGDLLPTAYATPAPDNRIAILDDVTGVIRFIDGTTRMDITQYGTPVPTIGSQSFISGFVAVGPDDVLYVNEGSADNTSLAAYARTGDKYKEVARVANDTGNVPLMLGPNGVMAMGTPTPLMPYVAADGQPSGATLDLDELATTAGPDDTYSVDRSGTIWNVRYLLPADTGLPPSETCTLCASGHLGPAGSVVLTTKSPTADGDLQTKLSVLSDQVTTYDTDWDYIGVLNGQLLFDRLDQDSIDLGTVDL
jgi:hypothetical protein